MLTLKRFTSEPESDSEREVVLCVFFSTSEPESDSEKNVSNMKTYDKYELNKW